MLQLPSGSGTSTRTSPAAARRVAVPPGRPGSPLGKAAGSGAPCPGGTHEDEPSSFTPTPNPSAASPWAWARRVAATKTSCSQPGSVLPQDKESSLQNGSWERPRGSPCHGSTQKGQSSASFCPARPRTRWAGTDRSLKLLGAGGGWGGTNRHGHTELHPIKCFSLGKQAARQRGKKEEGQKLLPPLHRSCLLSCLVPGCLRPGLSQPPLQDPRLHEQTPGTRLGRTVAKGTRAVPHFPSSPTPGDAGGRGRRWLEMLKAP